MLSGYKKKEWFLYTPRGEKYFDFSGAFYGHLYGYADKFTSSIIKKHLSKRKEYLRLNEKKLLDFYRSQFQSLLRTNTGQKIPDYFYPVLISEHSLSHYSNVWAKKKKISDHDLMFSLENKWSATSKPAVIVANSCFPYLAELIFFSQQKNIKVEMILCAEEHPFFLGKRRLALIDIRSDWSKNFVQEAACQSIDFWQLFVYLEIIRHHHQKAKSLIHQKKIQKIKDKMNAVADRSQIKMNYPDFSFPGEERYATLTIKKEIMEKWQKQSAPFSLPHSEENRIFFPKMCITKKEQSLLLFLPLSQEYLHLENRWQKLINFVSKSDV